jgi:hypothetical protein
VEKERESFCVWHKKGEKNGKLDRKQLGGKVLSGTCIHIKFSSLI